MTSTPPSPQVAEAQGALSNQLAQALSQLQVRGGVASVPLHATCVSVFTLVCVRAHTVTHTHTHTYTHTHARTHTCQADLYQSPSSARPALDPSLISALSSHFRPLGRGPTPTATTILPGLAAASTSSGASSAIGGADASTHSRPGVGGPYDARSVPAVRPSSLVGPLELEMSFQGAAGRQYSPTYQLYVRDTPAAGGGSEASSTGAAGGAGLLGAQGVHGSSSYSGSGGVQGSGGAAVDQDAASVVALLPPRSAFQNVPGVGLRTQPGSCTACCLTPPSGVMHSPW